MEMGSAAPGPLASPRGRAEECARLDALVEDVRRGESRSLVLRGEPGIGKTALLEYLIASTSDLIVLRAVGVESEMELAYASLHQLCAPVLEQLERLPAPQRQALETVFGLSGGPPPDRFLVGLGGLSLLSEAAEERPLLCVVDDAQWLDQASALTLAFVARRLLAEPIGIVFATRQSNDELEHLSELELHGLVNGDARALLESALRFGLDARVRDRIVAESRGNPLALLELPRGLTPTELAGGFRLPETRGLTTRIERSFVRRLEALSDETLRLLLVAAAEPVGDPVLLWRAAGRLGIEPEAVDPAEREGLVAVGERVIFRHPLVRSAVYTSSSAEDCRAVHLALAEVTDREAEPDRRAWHLATAAAGPDEEVATELVRSAERARARGGFAAAAAFLQRAVALSLDPGARADRALAAVGASTHAGAFETASRLLVAAEAGPLDEFGRANADVLRGQVAFGSADPDAPKLLLQGATRMQPLDVDLARETYMLAWGAAALRAHPSDSDTLADISRHIRTLPLPATPDPLARLLAGLATLAIEGPAHAFEDLRRAATALTAETAAVDVVRSTWGATPAVTALWDANWLQAVAAQQIELAREVGALDRLPFHLSTLAVPTALMGDLVGAASVAAEIDSVTAATGRPPIRAATGLLAALRGSEAATAAADRLQARARAKGAGSALAHWPAAIHYNGLARFEDALSAARDATMTPTYLWPSMLSLPELVEAAARTGAREGARGAIEPLAESARASGTDWALGVAARCRALLAEEDEAERLYREAIERLARTRMRPDLARARLLYGEWLRRESRRVDAREQLRVAHEQFLSIGMEAFAERTRRELVATGGTVRKRTVEARDDLTAQERQVALLARDGLSNVDIGARLFLSRHTVAYHLRKVFSKLGISSRRELAAALPESEVEPASA
ncbi:MAG TPA: AAA family ATPase [Thermoleophilaceae bacterium]|nr:AAA family ATPase [Thermoleophilaceae bacterium]